MQTIQIRQNQNRYSIPEQKRHTENKNFDINDNSIDTARVQCKMQFSLIKDFSVLFVFCVCSREKLQDKDLIFYFNVFIMFAIASKQAQMAIRYLYCFTNKKFSFFIELETFLMKSPGGLCWLIFMDFTRLSCRSLK